MFDAPLRINRNIVECKLYRLYDFCFFCLRINRNIVECKFYRDCPETSEQIVLIETLWNVNDITGILRKTLYAGINRNIVECKLL